jgi:signal transduction histidine kinase
VSISIAQLGLEKKQDIVLARRTTKEVAVLAGLSAQDQAHLTTAVSEIVSNALQYAGQTSVEFRAIEQNSKHFLQVIVRDSGNGIPGITDMLLADNLTNPRGSGIRGARNLVDFFKVESSQTGTTIYLAKRLAEPCITPATAAKLTARLPAVNGSDMLVEIQDQNKQLMQTLEYMQDYKRELEQQLAHVHELNDELRQINAGVLALNRELDDSKSELLLKTQLLERQKEQLQEATKNKSDFLANMSHEIRTPMNGILGMTEILLKSDLTYRQREFANTIRQAGLSLLSVINDVLDFSKIEAGKLTLEIVEFEPARLLEDIAGLLVAQAKQNGLTLLTFVDPEIPLVLRGDPNRLRQILVNLAGNAIKFSANGTIVMRAALECLQGHTAQIKFSVTDPGIGMTEEELNKLFEPFAQFDNTTPHKFGGTGLGLSISKRLVELMFGRITVTSVKKHGSTFSFLVPLETGCSKTIKELAPANLSGLRVLVVDDDHATLEIMHNYVLSWGLQYGCAVSAEEALAVLDAASSASGAYDLAIIDLVMPNMKTNPDYGF